MRQPDTCPAPSKGAGRAVPSQPCQPQPGHVYHTEEQRPPGLPHGQCGFCMARQMHRCGPSRPVLLTWNEQQGKPAEALARGRMEGTARVRA